MDLELTLKKIKFREWSSNIKTVLSSSIIRPAYVTSVHYVSYVPYVPNITILLSAVNFLNERCYLNHNRCLDWTATSPILLSFKPQ
jgi:hypothetical protein